MLLLLLAAGFLNAAAAFYLPGASQQPRSVNVGLCFLIGAAPKDYTKNEPVVLDVNALRPGLGYDEAKLVSTVLQIPHNAMLIFPWP